MDVKNTTVVGNHIFLTPNPAMTHFQSMLAMSEIAFVVKRTWGPIRKKALSICEQLERRGVHVLNTCAFIRWSHSKIQQHSSLKEWAIFPETICFDNQFMAANKGKSERQIMAAVVDKMSLALSFPLILKTDEGCRGDGIYLLHSIEELTSLMHDLLAESSRNPHSEFKNGFLLQKFIATHDDQAISNYYRINLVNGVPQSAVQFQLQWKKSSNQPYQKLVEFPTAANKPVSLELFPVEQLGKIAQACPCQQGVVGIDVTYQAEKMHLLEYNDGPIISQISELAEQYHGNQAATACANFVSEIASLCVKKIELMLAANVDVKLKAGEILRAKL